MDSTYTATFLASIARYERQLQQFPDAKNSVLDLDKEMLLSVRSNLRELWSLTDIHRTPFKRFSFAKHALQCCVQTNYLTEQCALLPSWLHSYIEVGAYDGCIKFVDVCVRSNVLRSKMKSADYLSMLFCRAKSLRNIGHFSKAQQAYRDAIDMAAAVGSQTDVNYGLLLIGKLYGNYLGQRSLFSSFVEEAKDRFDEQRSKFTGTEADDWRIIRGIAICHDALGQAYRDSDRVKVERHFLEAIKMNQMIDWSNGISRAVCHLNYFRFQHTHSPQDRASYIEEFKEGLKLLTKGQPDERGLSIRFIQFSSMLREVNLEQKAKQYLQSGKSFATRYSLYKTLTQAAIVEAQLFKASDPDRALFTLEEGRTIAQEYSLALQETAINRLLAELKVTAEDQKSQHGTEPFDLFSRNRDILMNLVGEVKRTLAQLDSSGDLKPEFKHLKRKTRRTFRERLLLDFDHIVEQLNLNMLSLLKTSTSNERTGLFEIVGSIAPSLLELHEAFILSDDMLLSCQDIVSHTEQILDSLQWVRDNSQLSGDVRKKVRKPYLLVKGLSTQMEELTRGLQRLRTLMSDRIGQTELEGMVSLKGACEQAIAELKRQTPSIERFITFNAKCDVQIRCNFKILTTMVRNLIRAVLTVADDNLPAQRNVTVSLEAKPGKISSHRADLSVALFSVGVLVDDELMRKRTVETLRSIVNSQTTHAPFGSSTGVDLAKLVFGERLGAQMTVYNSGNSVKIQVLLETSEVQVEICPIDPR
jgi:hypothetical protein